ncbi:MAG: ATP-dependent zinc metalloprotease FtsH [bacterium]
MKGQQFKAVIIWILIITGALWFVSQLQVQPNKREKISFSEFIKSVQDGNVEKVTFRGTSEISGKFKANIKSGGEFETVGDTRAESYLNLLREKNLIPDYESEPKPTFLQQALLTWVPTLFIVFLFFLFMRQLQSGSNKALSFGQSRAKLYSENQSKIRFNDVAGCDEAKMELQEIVEFLKNPKKFTRLGGKIPKGVLLIGQPGTGKTLLAKAVAGEASVPFFSISGSDFVEMFVGVGASRVRSLFENARRAAPCLVFIDEIDAVGRHRGAGLGGGHDEREQTLNQLLVEMDGFEGTEGVIIVAATNRADVLDPALLRPGRFDRRVSVPKPDLKGREEILGVHTKKVPLSGDVLLNVIARGTPGFSGADLSNLVNEAALIAARHDSTVVSMRDFEEAKDKVAMGNPRKSLVMKPDEKRHTAYHEAGHALVAHFVPGNDPVHKITIIPRGPALGFTMTLPTEEQFSMTKDRAESILSYMMGGRAAEQIVFGHLTTGASNDIERATDLARKMVTEWGMSERLGPLNFASQNDNIFLGKELGSSTHFSAETSQLIDREIRDIVERNHKRAREVLMKHEKELHAVSLALLDVETLDAEQFKMLCSGKTLEEVKLATAPLPPRVAPSAEVSKDVKSTQDENVGIVKIPDPSKA